VAQQVQLGRQARGEHRQQRPLGQVGPEGRQVELGGEPHRVELPVVVGVGPPWPLK